MVINNVGIDYFNPLDKVNPEIILDMIKINIISTVMITRHFLPKFIEKYDKK